MTKEILNCFVIFVPNKALGSFRYTKTRSFYLNKAHYLKLYIVSNVYRDEKSQSLEGYKYTFDQVHKCFSSKLVRLVYRNHGLVESNKGL